MMTELGKHWGNNMMGNPLKLTVRRLKQLGLMIIFISSGVWANTSPPSALFSTPSMLGDMPYAPGNEVTRSRFVKVDKSLLASTAPLLTLNLFDDTSVVAVHERTEKTPRGIVWIGHLQNKPLSQVIIVANGENIAGNITSAGTKRYHLRFVDTNIHAIQEIDVTKYPEDEPSVPVPPPKRLTTPALDSAHADDGTMIDVMVAYSDDARSAVGGTAAMQTLIDLAIAETNHAYTQSTVAPQLRLVHSQEMSYTESGNLETDLNCITVSNDGCLDSIHTLRDTHKADLVSFWVKNGGSYCGIAWLMDSISPAFADWGYSVVDKDCATGYYSFGHELGHNMGLNHDIYVDPQNAPYPHSHGYAYPADGWRTIMAYNSVCEAQGKNCQRLQYFSNPNILQDAVPMGDESTADNHRVLNDVADTVANFRQQGLDTTPTAFHFTDQSTVALSSVIESDEITVSGINTTTNITVSGGEYSINGGIYTAGDGTIENGDKVKVRHTSSANYAVETDTILSIGGITDTFTSTTLSQSSTLNISKIGLGIGTVRGVFSDTNKLAGINCGTDCNETYATSGQTIKLTAKPASNSVFTGWSGNCSGINRICTVAVTGITDVTADFNLITHTLAVTKMGAGSVSSVPTGIDCGADCDESYLPNARVTLTASADNGYQFTGWSGACTNKTNTCRLNMTAAKNVTANFTPLFNLSVTKTGTGSGSVKSQPAGINCGTDCSEDFLENTKVTLTAKPDKGKKFVAWSGGCSGTKTTCKTTLSETKSVSAEFTSQ